MKSLHPQQVRFEVTPKGALAGGARVCISVAALNRFLLPFDCGDGFKTELMYWFLKCITVVCFWKTNRR